MDTWQQYTLRANTEFKLACYGNAILMHNQALDYARHHFCAAGEGCCFGHAVARVMISNFSLADCYTALGEYRRAADCYLEAQRFLLDLPCLGDGVGDAGEALLHAQSHLHTLWCEFLGKHADRVPYDCQLTYHSRSCELVREIEGRAVRH